MFFFSIERLTAYEGRSFQTFDLPCIEIVLAVILKLILLTLCTAHSGDLNTFEVIPLYQIVFKHSSRNQKRLLRKHKSER